MEEKKETVVLDINSSLFCRDAIGNMADRISQLEREVHMLRIQKYELAYYLVEMDIRDKLDQPYNKLSHEIISKNVRSKLLQLDFGAWQIEDMINTIKLQWDAAHYEEK